MGSYVAFAILLLHPSLFWSRSLLLGESSSSHLGNGQKATSKSQKQTIMRAYICQQGRGTYTVATPRNDVAQACTILYVARETPDNRLTSTSKLYRK